MDQKIHWIVYTEKNFQTNKPKVISYRRRYENETLAVVMFLFGALFTWSQCNDNSTVNSLFLIRDSQEY